MNLFRYLFFYLLSPTYYSELHIYKKATKECHEPGSPSKCRQSLGSSPKIFPRLSAFFFFRFQHFWNWNEERHLNLKGKVMATPMFLFLSWLTKKLLSMSIIKPQLNFTQLYTRNKGTRTGRCWEDVALWRPDRIDWCGVFQTSSDFFYIRTNTRGGSSQPTIRPKPKPTNQPHIRDRHARNHSSHTQRQ